MNIQDFSSTAPIDLILYNGILASGHVDTPIIEGAEALAVSGGRIVALGTNDTILNLGNKNTETVNLGGRLVVPGFVDTHIHFYEWALKRRNLQLDRLTSLDDLLALVAETAGNLPPGDWIMGQGWNETDWHSPHMPDREALDRVAPDHPVLLWRCDLHLAVANSAALRLGGIDSATPDPPEGRIEKDENGEPTGILRELAINLIRRAVSPPGAHDLQKAFIEAAKELHSLGITGIDDIRLMEDEDGARALRTFEALNLDNRLDLRCWVALPGHRLEEAIGLGLTSGFGGDRLRLGHVKYFADGGMGARTAWMIDPFLDADHGMPLMDMEVLAESIAKADRNGLSVMVHGVGDRANRELIDIFTGIEQRRRLEGYAPPLLPHRIEHAQMVREEDVEKLAGLDLALCVTPCNMVLDINLIDNAVGEKGKYTYAFRRLIDSKAPVMFSSDCPVCRPDPLPAIHAAVTRQRPDGTPEGGWYPEERISQAEALAAYTSVPAGVHRASDQGTITLGNRADLAILENNILTIEPARIADTNVDMTIFNGQIVYRNF